MSKKMFKNFFKLNNRALVPHLDLINSPGLYQFNKLKQPDDFLNLMEESKQNVNSLKSTILNTELNSLYNTKNILYNIDTISNELCLLLDSCSLTSVTHENDAFREKADYVSQYFGSFLHELNTNGDLHEKMKEIIENKEMFSKLDDEEKRIIILLKNDMEKNGGVHLSDENKNLVIGLNEKIDYLSFQFSNFLNSSNVDQLQIYQILNDIIDCRHKLALVLGSKSYSHLYLADLVAKNPENVKSFLHDLLLKIENKCKEEVTKLKNYANESDLELHRDNYSFFIKHLRNQSQKSIKEYFHVNNCIEGLNLICNEIFNVELRIEDVHDNEIWNSEVKNLSVYKKGEGFLGNIYLDLFVRENKSNMAATCTIRTGKQISDVEYQNPAVAIVLNFIKDPNLLLEHEDVVTLFHEFGHAIHTLFSRTKFQHTSGARTSLDFVEFPSQFMEYFALDYRVVSKFSNHYLTHEVIDEISFEKSMEVRNSFSTLTLQNEIIKSLIDLELFGIPDKNKNIQLISNDLYNTHSSLPINTENKNSNLSLSIHLTSYGSVYYGYIYSKVFSSHVWHKFFKDDPFNKESGLKLYNSILKRGGSRSPNDMLDELLNEKPTIDYLLKDYEI